MHPGRSRGQKEKPRHKDGAQSRSRPLIFFYRVAVLQLPQQRPRQNYAQDEGHENAKGNENHAHEILAISPTNPKNRTTAPIAPATMATYFN